MTRKAEYILVRLPVEGYTLVSELQRIVKCIGMEKASNITLIDMEPNKMFTKGRAISFAMQYTIQELMKRRV